MNDIIIKYLEHCIVITLKFTRATALEHYAATATASEHRVANKLTFNKLNSDPYSQIYNYNILIDLINTIISIFLHKKLKYDSI